MNTTALKVLVLTLLPTSLFADSSCDKHGVLVLRLLEKYDEQVVMQGIDFNGNMVELFVSKDDGSWTFIQTNTNMFSCIFSAGHSANQIPYTDQDASLD